MLLDVVMAAVNRTQTLFAAVVPMALKPGLVILTAFVVGTTPKVACREFIEHWQDHPAPPAGTPVQVTATAATAPIAAEHLTIFVITEPEAPSLVVPFTSNLAPGIVVPIPTLPVESTRMRSLPAPSLIEMLLDPVAKVDPVLEPMITLLDPVVIAEPEL